MNFYVGQEVLCIDNTEVEDSLSKYGEYVIDAIRLSPCCKKLELSIGHTYRDRMTRCTACKSRHFSAAGSRYYRANRFIPKDNELSNLTVDEIINETVDI